MVVVILVVVFLQQVLLNVAKEAPGCFLQHLQSLVQQVEQLWAAGQLREGEKVGAPAAAAVSNPRLACTHVCELKLQLLDSPRFFHSAQLSPTHPTRLNSAQCSTRVQVALHEGLMVSVSRAGSLELQTQLLEVRTRRGCMLCRAAL